MQFQLPKEVLVFKQQYRNQKEWYKQDIHNLMLMIMVLLLLKSQEKMQDFWQFKHHLLPEIFKHALFLSFLLNYLARKDY